MRQPVAVEVEVPLSRARAGRLLAEVVVEGIGKRRARILRAAIATRVLAEARSRLPRESVEIGAKPDPALPAHLLHRVRERRRDRLRRRRALVRDLSILAEQLPLARDDAYHASQVANRRERRA